MDIQGKVALVTGANRGIGLSIAQGLLDAGVGKLYAAVRNPASAKALVEQYGNKVVALELDLSKPDTIKAAAQEASDVDIVVNNGGVLRQAGPFSADGFDNLDFEIDVNVKGLMRMAHAFVPVLKANAASGDGGAFVQLNSVASLRNFADFATYAMSKAAAYSYTQALRDTVTEAGILVVSVHPGPIETDMASQAGFEGEMTDPPSVVADATVEAIKNNTFHVFPDKMARDFWAAYRGFAEAVVEPAMAEG